jgi:uncharacterized protein involved in exopolysaccharide biosynthesis
MNKELDRNQIKDMIRRRKKGFMIIFLLLFFTGLTIALALPPVYKAEALIRINDQEVSEGLAKLTTSDYVEQRIEKINQRVLSYPRLEEIIEEFNLYSQDKNQVNVSESVGKFRENIHMDAVVSEMQSKPGGKDLSFTLAFNLSFEGEDPETVQKVTDKLANLYIEEDIKRTENVMSATTDFLKAEQERLTIEIERQENKISEFKKKHLRELPSDLRSNIQMVGRLERELDKANLELKSLNEKKIYLESALRNVEPLTPIVIEGNRIATNPSQRLKELNIQLTKMKSIYSDKHPDIKKIQREINELETQVQSSDNTVRKIKRLQYLENQLASLESDLGPKHPDVVKTKKEIAVLSKEVNNQMTESKKMKISEENPDNPAYISLVTQINSINMQINAIKEDEEKILQSIAEYEKRIEISPIVENEFHTLTRDYETLKDKYKEILNELMSAQVAKNVEGTQRGQGFIIASPPYLPTKPYKPNRLAIILVGLIIAIGIGFIITAFQESMDNSIKATDQIRQIIGAPVLTSISYIVTDREKRNRRLKHTAWLLFVIMCVGAGLYLVNQYVIELEYLWSVILERIMMIA